MKINKHSYTSDIKIGDRFGKLITIFYDKTKFMWYCDCDCGGHVYVNSNKLIKGIYTSCNCSRGLGKKIEIGEKYNNLTVIKFDKEKELWLCRCDCGKFVYNRSDKLKRGVVKSCGCKKFGPKINRRRPDNETLKLNLFRSYKDNAKYRKRIFNLSENTFFKLIMSNCYYCGLPPNSTNKKIIKYDGNFKYNGIDRVNNNLGYVENNCVACCESCNRAKLEMDVNDFKDWVKRIYKNLELEQHQIKTVFL